MSGVVRSDLGMVGPPAHIQSDIFRWKWAQVSCRIIGSTVTMRPEPSVARPPTPGLSPAVLLCPGLVLRCWFAEGLLCAPLHPAQRRCLLRGDPDTEAARR